MTPSIRMVSVPVDLPLKLIDTLKPLAVVAEKLKHCHVVEVCEPTADNPSRNIIPMPREWFERAADDLEAIAVLMHGAGVLSEGQASTLTGLDRVEVRKQADALTAAPVREEGGAAGVASAAGMHFATVDHQLIGEGHETYAAALAEARSSLATREEAPAEAVSLIGDAGDADCPTCQGSGLMRVEIGLHNPDATVETQPCDRCPGLNGARVRLANMARDIDLGLTPLAGWPAQLSNPTSATAKATARDIGLVLTALRAQPPAREDAQPVAWRMIGRDGSTISLQAEPYHGGFAHMMESDVGCTVQPLYTHPALDALRVELELLEEVCARYADAEDAFLSDEGEPFGNITTECGMKARDARRRFRDRLAALQAEQKGGAA